MKYSMSYLLLLFLLSFPAWAVKEDGKPVNHIIVQTGPQTGQTAGAATANSAMALATQTQTGPDFSDVRSRGEAHRAQAARYENQTRSIESLLRKYGDTSDLNRLYQQILSSASSSDDRITRASNQWMEKKLDSFRSNRQDLKDLYKALFQVKANSDSRRTARQIGLIAVEEANTSYTEGQNEDGVFFQGMAQGFLDIAVGLDPVTGLARSTYELFTGRNLITGEKLSPTEHAFAFIGMMTAGGGRTVLKASQLASKTMNRVFSGAIKLLENRQKVEAAIREGEILGGKVEHLVQGWKKNHILTEIKTAEEANAAFLARCKNPKDFKPPYEVGTHVTFFKTLKETQWVRIHVEDNRVGYWFARKSEIRGLTPAQIQEKFALPELPTYISDIKFPAHTKMSRGNVQYHQFPGLPPTGKPGAVQYHLEETIENLSELVTNTRALPEVFL